MDTTETVDRGWQALDACDWEAARDHLEAAVAENGGPRALHGLGLACYWLAEYPRALETLHGAYAAYRDRDDDRPAARVATQLALLHGLIEGNATAAGGWVRHAERALDGADECVEAGWLALLRACFTPDPDERARFAGQAIELGRRCRDAAVEFDGLAYLGKAHVERGRHAEGLLLVDEAVAAVSGGLVSDPWATAEILCVLFHTCELAVDVQRAQGWLAAVDDHVTRTGELPTYGICRTHFGGLLVSAGRWSDAERELTDAIAVYDAGFQGSRAEPVLRLADLRVRQGRVEEARRLLAGYEDLAEAAAPLARLHLAERDPAAARTVLRRFLERRGRGHGAVAHLALLVEAELADGRIDGAAAVGREIAELAHAGDQPRATGLALLCQGRVAAAAGQSDAVAFLEQALHVFADADLPCELAQTHLELAQCQRTTEPDAARMEARAALDGFRKLGSAAGADAAAALLRDLGERRTSRAPAPDGALTGRESEVLALLAEGAANADIAARLHISVRTVEHHVSNILAKLGVDNRTQAVAARFRAGIR